MSVIIEEEVSKSETPATTPEELELNRRCDCIISIITKPIDETTIDVEIADHLKYIETHSLHCAARIDGESEFESFPDFTDYLVKRAREQLRASGAGLKTGYKRINEAVVRNRVASQTSVRPPWKRIHAQILEHVSEEKQGKAWENTVTNAKGTKITASMVVEGARQAGETMDDPAPSASSELAVARKHYLVLRPVIEDAATKAGFADAFGHFDSVLNKQPRSSRPERVGDGSLSNNTGFQEQPVPQDIPSADTFNEPLPSSINGEGEKGDDLKIDPTSTHEQILARMVANLSRGAEATEEALQTPSPESGASNEAKAKNSAKQDVANAITTPANESPPPDAAKIAQREDFILVLPNGSISPMFTAKRPWVTAFEGTVFVAFESPDHLQVWVAAGFPHPKPTYGFKGYKFGKVWEFHGRLNESEQLTEVQRISELLVAAHANGAPLKEPQKSKSA